MQEATKNRQEIATIKYSLMVGDITYEKAQELAKPIIKRINEKGKEIAKKYGKKYRAVTFIELMR